jgi:nitroimidazol reductase NimA-like FMN-containing flavoprotein (pyridoxamine 5'-phosphate oxidase superfamily)
MSTYGLVELDREECLRLAATKRIGRVALLDHDEPAVLPVVYAIDGDDVVFRTAPGQKLVAAVLQRVVVFEVDAYDEEARTGWSVNIVGPASEIVHPAELARARALSIEPWAGEARDRFVRISNETTTGRRLDAVR